MKRLLAAVAAGLALAGCDNGTGPGEPTAIQGQRIYGVDMQNRLVVFGSSSVGTVRVVGTISGVQPGESILGIDFRPVDGKLYALGSSSRLYMLDTASAAATAIGSGAFTPTVSGSAVGFDFNPVPDRVRVHAGLGQNLRLNQLTGTVAAVDTALSYSAGDPGAATLPTLSATAYTNSVAGATSTMLFAIDHIRNTLVLLPAPNGGRVTTVGPLGIDATSSAGLDITPNGGIAFAALTDAGGRTALYTINLTTGTATAIGELRGVEALQGIAVAP
jgi:DNA-binding beta-propeller fold protein YncE